MGWKMNQVLSEGKYLRAVDCDPPILVTLSHVTQEEVGQERESKYVLWFSENEKGLVLNKVNGETISQIVGTDESDAWPGHKVVLFKTQTDYSGKRVDCIRVRAPKGAAAAPVKQAQPAEVAREDEDCPF